MRTAFVITHLLLGRVPSRRSPSIPSTSTFASAFTITRREINARLLTSTTILPATFAPDYDERSKANNFNSPKEIMDALKKDGTVVLDVRSEDEIAEAKFDVPDNVKWTSTSCTPSECPALETDASKFVKDKDTTVVVHCASGARANRAKITLEEQGYTNVLNGGGLKDMLVYPEMDL